MERLPKSGDLRFAAEGTRKPSHHSYINPALHSPSHPTLPPRLHLLRPHSRPVSFLHTFSSSCTADRLVCISSLAFTTSLHTTSSLITAFHIHHASQEALPVPGRAALQPSSSPHRRIMSPLPFRLLWNSESLTIALSPETERYSPYRCLR